MSPVLLSLSGCASVHSAYQPQSAFSVDDDLKEFHRQFASASSIKNYYAAGAETRERRNEFIAGRLTLCDLEYIRFVSRVRLDRAGEATAMDAAALGIGLATTIVDGERAKTILGAVTTALTGARASYEKNFYDDKTTSALITQMNAERKTALLPILAGTRSSIDEYPLSRALIDLANYQFSGSIAGALDAVQRDASIKDAAASSQLEQYRVVSFNPDDLSTRIRKWLFPGVVTFDAAGVARNDRGVEVPINSGNLTVLRAKIKVLGLEGVPLATLLVSKNLASARGQIVSELTIP